MTEILSPCGSFDSITAAVRSGADAVYLGFGDFNARRNAKNFTFVEFKDAASYCRKNGVKIYITLNTLLSESEIQDAIEVSKTLVSLGADAFIVQDLGLAKALKTALPDMPLHASTQMVIHSYEGLEALKELGFCRVVAAREMDKKSLKKLCDKAKELGIEVEVFVHGALCMCLSGACLMSSQIGGRSGNRGMCAQPCRLPFNVDGGNGYDLSLKDLSLISKLSELASMGVTSFKIEGRMKRPEYVAAATAAARHSLDNGFVPQNIQQMLTSVFSRSGFTDGYYENRLGKDMFGRRSEENIEDSAAVIKSIHELYRVERQKIGIEMKLVAKKNKNLQLTVCDGKNTVTIEGKEPETAKVKATDEEFIKSKLEKLGGTCYYAKNIVCDIDDQLAIGGGALGELRRNALLLLDAKRSEIPERKFFEYSHKKADVGSSGCEYIARFRTLSQIPDDLGGISAVILPVENDFSKVDFSIPVYAELPRAILASEEKITEYLNLAKPYIKGAVCSNLCSVELCKKAGVPFVTDIFMNIYNSEAAEVVKELGAKWYSVSAETAQSNIKNMPKDKAFFAYGYLPLMVTRNCPSKNGKGCSECDGISYGTDRLGNTFAISCRNGFSEIFNSVPHYLLDRVDEFGCDKAILHFTIEGKAEAEKIIAMAIGKSAPDGKYTRGLYYRTIL